MSEFRLPVVGRPYCVLCPECHNVVSFNCTSTNVYGIRCYLCHTFIDLRNPSVPLPHGDDGIVSQNAFAGVRGSAVRYSVEVEESNGSSATAQVAVLMDSFAKERDVLMPKALGSEVSEVFSARRIQAFADKYWFLHPLVHGIEYIFFGSHPVAKIGNVSIFRPWLPVIGSFNVPVVKTTTSYAVVLSLLIVTMGGLTYYAYILGDQRLSFNMEVVIFLCLLFCISLWRVAYSDPGYVRPAYLSASGPFTADPPLREAEEGQRGRESLWEVVDGERVERRWCATCEIYRPLRAAHCYFCGLCVDEQDHHCGVIGVCIGRRNIGAFLLVVLTGVVVAGATEMTVVMAVYGCVFDGAVRAAGTDRRDKKNCEALGVQFYAFAIFCLIAGAIFFIANIVLFVSTVSGVLMGITTRENLKGIYANGRNPFDKGPLQNLRLFLTRGKPSSIINNELVAACADQAKKGDTTAFVI
uniref:Palmitoyltransferase n=1 Tax=Trypanosoma congolense (strain IL3000) TaxID=1068625 RepID=G0V1F6_TRYCI|nr:unnamed protein product [Trypanosoma congolense IL3000]